MVFPGGSAVQQMQETRIQSLGWDDPLDEEMATQYSCPENSMDRGAWQAAIHVRWFGEKSLEMTELGD